jgi:sugar phosphate permease
MAQKKSVFYGWWIVVVLSVACFTMAAHPFGIILKDLMVEFDSTRGLVSLSLSISTIASGICGLFIGKLIIKKSPKKFLIGGIILGGVSFLALSFSPNLWYAWVLFFINGAAMAAAGVIPIFTILSRWFKRKWGTAVGLVMTGTAVGGMVLSPVNGFIRDNLGWQYTFIFAGVLFLVVNIPLVLIVVRDGPEQMGLQPDGDPVAEEAPEVNTATVAPTTGTSGMKVLDYLKKYQLWLIGIGFLLLSLGDMAVTQHQVSFITDMNISYALAASALGFTLGLSGAGRLIAGWLADRFSSRYVSILFTLVALAGILILMQADTMSGVWFFVIVYGLGTGASTTMLPLVITEIFGAASFSFLFAVIDIFYKTGSIVGTPMAGFIFDATGSYHLVFVIVAAFYGLSMFCVYFAFGARPGPLFKKG